MRLIYSLFFLLLFATCIIDDCNKDDRRNQVPMKIVPVHDTVFVSVVDRAKVDSLNHVIDALNTKLFIATYKIERVNYYLKICLRNPTQDKFLKGWISRAVQ